MISRLFIDGYLSGIKKTTPHFSYEPLNRNVAGSPCGILLQLLFRVARSENPVEQPADFFQLTVKIALGHLQL